MQIKTEDVIQELLKSLQKAAKGKKTVYTKTKTKTTQIIYDEILKKPVQEIVTETEEIKPKTISSDMQTLKTASAIIKELHSLSAPDSSASGGVVILAGENIQTTDE